MTTGFTIVFSNYILIIYFYQADLLKKRLQNSEIPKNSYFSVIGLFVVADPNFWNFPNFSKI